VTSGAASACSSSASVGSVRTTRVAAGAEQARDRALRQGRTPWRGRAQPARPRAAPGRRLGEQRAGLDAQQRRPFLRHGLRHVARAHQRQHREAHPQREPRAGAAGGERRLHLRLHGAGRPRSAATIAAMWSARFSPCTRRGGVSTR
jgi:hypothetical protein